MMFLLAPSSISSVGLSKGGRSTRSTFNQSWGPTGNLNSNPWLRKATLSNRYAARTTTTPFTFRLSSPRQNDWQSDMYLSLCWSMVKSCIRQQSSSDNTGAKIPWLHL